MSCLDECTRDYQKGHIWLTDKQVLLQAEVFGGPVEESIHFSPKDVYFIKYTLESRDGGKDNYLCLRIDVGSREIHLYIEINTEVEKEIIRKLMFLFTGEDVFKEDIKPLFAYSAAAIARMCLVEGAIK